MIESKTTAVDVRSGRPSASIFTRLRACPGSWLLSQGQPDVTTPHGQRGTGIHRWIQSKLSNPPAPTPTLSADDEETAETCLRLVDRACAAAGYGSRSSATNVFCEQRLWHDDAWSGQFDVALHWGDRWLLVDFKTGRAEVAEPADNQQLRALVALLASNYFPSEVTVAIVQPWVSPQIPPLSRYAGAALAQAEHESDLIVANALKPGAPRTPGEHCTYCPAAAVCPELLATTRAVIVMPSAEAVPAADMSRWLDLFDQAELVIESGRKRARAMLSQDPGCIPGYTLTPGTVRESITDIKTVFGRSAAIGVSADAFTAACSVTKKNLKDLLRSATGQKGNALETTMETVLKDCTESKPTAPSLKRL